MGGEAIFNFEFNITITITNSLFYNSMWLVKKCSEAHKNVLLTIVCFFLLILN